MNIVHFDKGVWQLHRRLHHRFIKFSEYVNNATEDLEDYITREEDETTKRGRLTGGKDTATAASCATSNVVCLLSDSSESDDE